MEINLPAKSFWQNKRVFITGHTGFKGSWLTILLNELGADVCGYSLAPTNDLNLYDLCSLKSSIKSIIGDIRDEMSLKSVMIEFQPEIVFHLAAQPLVIASYHDPVDTFSTNVMGTVNLLNASRSIDSIKSIVIVTTDKVYKNQNRDLPYTETDELGGHDPYSNSKVCCEFVVDSFRNSFLSKSSKFIATARAGNVIGGGDWSDNRLVPDFFRALHARASLTIRNLDSVRPWQFVLEPIVGYLLLAESLYTNEEKFEGSWNFGPEFSTSHSVNDVIKNLCEISGYDLTNINVVSSEDLKETNILRLDSNKSFLSLGFQSKWSLEKTLESIFDFENKRLSQFNMKDVVKEQISEYFNNSL